MVGNLAGDGVAIGWDVMCVGYMDLRQALLVNESFIGSWTILNTLKQIRQEFILEGGDLEQIGKVRNFS